MTRPVALAHRYAVSHHRDRVMAYRLNTTERYLILKAMEQAGFPNASDGAREILLRFARSHEHRPTVAQGL